MEGAFSSSSSGLARAWEELRGRNCLRAGTRGRKRGEEEEEEERTAAAGGRRRRRRLRLPPPTTAAEDDEDDDGDRTALAAIPPSLLLPRPEQPGAEAAAKGSVQQAARIAADGIIRMRASLFRMEREERKGIMRKALTTRGEKTQCSSSLTKAVERKLFTELSLSRPFLSSPHSLRCPRHAPWPSLARGTCKFIVALPIHRRVRKREKGRKHWSLLSRSCGGLKATSVSLSPLPPFLTPSPSLHPILSRSPMHSQLNRTASVAAAAASRPALPVRRARLAPIAQASNPPKRPGNVEEE